MRTRQNPVYRGYFADPFVWKHAGKYYAVGTGPLGGMQDIVSDKDLTSTEIDGEDRAIPLLTSDNLFNWEFAGGALLVQKKFRHAAFWAPEVAYDGKHFFMYYSTATVGLLHQIRVAKSAQPEGPYEDVGALIGANDQCPFAIDAHPFRDDDDQWYLFYARDFLDESHGFRAGTALVVDRLIDMKKLAGEEKIVLRSRCDWQLFKAQREMYGRIWDWHTLEGPCVRKHEGLYYCFYSGGCYENESYGVDYGISENVFGPYDDSGNDDGPRVMKTVPDKIIGPGHHSIVLGPDDRTEYFAYHAWNLEMTKRQLYVDELVWTNEGPRCNPTRALDFVGVG